MQVKTLLNKSLTKKQRTILVGLSIVPLVGILLYLSLNVLQTSTSANQDQPQNITSSVIGTTAQITWTTQDQTVAIVEYGTSQDPTSFQDFAISEVPSSEHSVDIPNLEPNTTYYYRMKINDTYYDNDGLFWSFTTESSQDSTTSDETITGDTSLTPTAETTPATTPSATPAVVFSPSPTLNPQETPTASDSATPTPVNICDQNDCTAIKNALGNPCDTQDYIQCLNKDLVSVTPTTETTTTPTPTVDYISATTKLMCDLDYVQPNTCTSWGWPAMSTINKTCSDTFTEYFVQCKSSSFESNDAATWFCNERMSSNELSLPCGDAPSPFPGQAVFCRVRAENETGGEANATGWTTYNTTCANLNTNISACLPSFLQANTCRSFLWDLVPTKNPTCSQAFSHYFLQCTNNNDFTGATGTWFCNTTTTDNYLDLPCQNAPTPADGGDIYCRVRAEDAYGTDNHSTDWVTVNATCPTSTPTPTYSPTPTPTNTPSPTP
ncbi:fibronectin type III domain-containing protein [Candidatus Woesebacteria bacterium]|nr:fibronectin type III domain-containing protein [Candidatus Woesebacteria bacterium]